MNKANKELLKAMKDVKEEEGRDLDIDFKTTMPRMMCMENGKMVTKECPYGDGDCPKINALKEEIKSLRDRDACIDNDMRELERKVKADMESGWASERMNRMTERTGLEHKIYLAWLIGAMGIAFGFILLGTRVFGV